MNEENQSVGDNISTGTIVTMTLGPAQLSNGGKKMVAASMYMKGRHFIAAALLLRKMAGYEYVVLHLICQGIEITLKSLLLFYDYDHYLSRLRHFGHDLKPLSNELSLKFHVRVGSSLQTTEDRRRPFTGRTNFCVNQVESFLSFRFR